ncbi:hypothetical protein [Legionella sp.]|uniref:hypothetical protein n=1 Tax=Legionella sp. TaxID=459 RepID=UPI003C8AA0E3
MLIPLSEPSNFRYIRINPTTNRVHLLVPFIAGLDISTDNTCKSEIELKTFFESAAFNELESYKNTLEFHISLLEKGDAHYLAKKERLDQINIYLKAVIGMRNSYKSVVNTFLEKPSNLYSIQLRPRTQDPYSRVVNPVFTINRRNDSRAMPLSPLYNKMYEVFPGLILGKSDPREQLITTILSTLTPNTSFENIQNVLAAQYHVPEDFFKKRLDERHQEQVVDRAYVDRLMGFDENTTPRVYIKTLLGLCAPNLQSTLQGSPFYFESSANPSEKTERLSILTQFYLGVLNVYCRAKGISDKNLGVILDSSLVLSHALVEIVAQALSRGEEVEPTLVAFFNMHKKAFNLTRDLTIRDKDAIQQKFETTYRTVTATKENPYMDDFMLLDTEAHGENDIFVTSKGLICTDFSNIAPKTSLNQPYFAEIRNEARTHREMVTPQDESMITVDITPEALINKLDDVQWEKLPKEVINACRASPVFKVRNLLDDVAKGKQDEANAILQSSDDMQILLRTPGKFTDYSGRTFHCTAYEYAYWAKDKHMCRGLESHMDDETKTILLEKIDQIECSGLLYQQHGDSFQNPHYDMSFVLKNLSLDEFHQLQTMAGQNSAKIQQATADNYQMIPFTATEYEALRKVLEHHRPKGFFSFFYPFHAKAKAISEKLQFDFHSLITALDTYVTNYDKWSHHEWEIALMSVGKAQREVPAHIAHEYCRPDRSFDPVPSFNEKTLPRKLTFNDQIIKSWFPLSSSSSYGLGFNFAVLRESRDHGAMIVANAPWPVRTEHGIRMMMTPAAKWLLILDLAAIRHLDEVRIADLTQLRENLSRPANQFRVKDEGIIKPRVAIQKNFESARISELKKALETYITRIEKHQTQNKQPDFKYGLMFFRDSRAKNRKANYNLTKELLVQLGKEEKSIPVIFGKANIENLRKEEKFHLSKTAIFSTSELSSIIKAARG